MNVLYGISESEFYQIGEVSNSHLKEDVVFSLSEEIDETADLFEIMSQKKITSHKPILKMKKALSLTDREALLVTSESNLKFLSEEIVENVQKCLVTEEDCRYVEKYLRQKKFLGSLKKPELNNQYLKRLVESSEHDNIITRILEFSRSTTPTKYRMSKTVTGRLVVQSGPNILTLPSQVRGAIKSKYSGGKILQMDLISAEPHMALLMANKKPPEDVYEHLAKEILDNKVTRKEAKLITLSALYGQSSYNLSKNLPKGVNAKDVIEKTKRYFNADALKSYLEKKLKLNNFRNVLGRPVKVDYERKDLLISYFLQSSIAECSVLSFDNFLSTFSHSATPYYVIHDALIFDTTAAGAKDLLSRKIINVSVGDLIFRAKVTLVSDN